MKIIKYIFSLEMFFALFLLVGVFKDALNLGIDPTVIFLGGTIFFAVIRLMNKQKIMKRIVLPFIAFMSLVCLIFISYYYTTSTVYSIDKMTKLIILTIPSFLIPLFFFSDKPSAKKFLNSFFIVCLGIALYSVYKILFADGGSVQGFFSINEGNYLGLGRALGVGVVLAFIKLIFESNFKKMPFYLILLVMFMYTLMMTGGRMPLLSAVMVFLLSTPFLFRMKKGIIYLHRGFKKFIFLLSILIVVLYVLIVQGYTTTSFNRIMVLFNEQGGGDSAHGRVLRYISALDLWGDHPFFGGGVGSFGLYFQGFDTRDYPHNMFLEALSELGMVGVLILIVLVLITLGAGFRNLYRDINTVDTVQLGAVMVAIYLFANANITGDINDNRILYTFLALCAAYRPIKNTVVKKTKKKSKPILGQQYVEKLSK